MNNEFNPPKIVFPHIMKTGGTSLIAWLQRHYFIETVLTEASTWPELYSLPSDLLAKKRFVRGHFGSGILNIFGEQNGFASIALVRDPVARVISHYWHYKKAPDANPIFSFVKEKSFSIEDFLTHPDTLRLATNYQTANYSVPLGDEFANFGPVEHERLVHRIDIEIAKSFIDKCHVVGLTEDMPAFKRDLSVKFGFFIDGDIGRERPYTEAMDIAEGTIDRIRELNLLDYQLYDYVKSKCERQSEWANSDYTNPIQADERGILFWKAGMPYWGCGWENPTMSEVPHSWSVKPSASIILKIPECRSGTLIVSILRFCTGFQEQTFTILCNGINVAPVKLMGNSDGTMRYVVSIEGLDNSQILNITFRVTKMARFTDIDSNSNDYTTRGLALSELMFIPGETLKKAASGMKRNAHGAQRPRHNNELSEEASTAQRSDSPAQQFIQRFPNGVK